MAIPKIKTVNASTYELSAIQENLVKIIDQFISNKEIIDGIPLKDVAIGTADTVINHKLGRTPLGYIVTTKSGLGDIYDTGRNSKTLTLISSAAVTVNLWVY